MNSSHKQVRNFVACINLKTLHKSNCHHWRCTMPGAVR